MSLSRLVVQNFLLEKQMECHLNNIKQVILSKFGENCLVILIINLTYKVAQKKFV